MALQVIGSGFGRTGTMSLKRALEQLGFGPCHHMEEVLAHPEQVRSLDGSILKEDANWVYDLVYSELHEGTAGYFRAMQAPERRKPPP